MSLTAPAQPSFPINILHESTKCWSAENQSSAPIRYGILSALFRFLHLPRQCHFPHGLNHIDTLEKKIRAYEVKDFTEQ